MSNKKKRKKEAVFLFRDFVCVGGKKGGKWQKNNCKVYKTWNVTYNKTMQVERYSKEFEEMQRLTKEEYLASLRRMSSGFSRGVSKYRGVARYILFN